MRKILLISIVMLTSGCGCVLEEGDSISTMDYINGCWTEAKGNPNEV